MFNIEHDNSCIQTCLKVPVDNNVGRVFTCHISGAENISFLSYFRRSTRLACTTQLLESGINFGHHSGAIRHVVDMKCENPPIDELDRDVLSFTKYFCVE